MFVVNKIEVSEEGRKISYDYSVSSEIAKYFKKKEPFYLHYQEDISTVPDSLKIIPLLASVMPIAWFVGFDVYVDEIDETFHNSLKELKKEFEIHFPEIKPNTQLHYKKLQKNTFDQNNFALLFSGGLDAFESLTRNIDKNPHLISVHGADIEIKDTKRWSEFKRFNSEETIIQQDKLCYVETNIRDFYTYEVDLLVGVGWWGKIQHGMALLSVIAPLSFLHGLTTIMIGSSNTGEVSFGWGSTSETDEKVRWANQKVVHDGFEFRRTEKVENIIKFAQKTGHKVKLRVCYSELRDGYNCNVCPKCQRTMLGFLLSGVNPDEYGFTVPNNIYDLILNNFNEGAVMTVGVEYEWHCLQSKARKIDKPFIIANEQEELFKFNTFVQLDFSRIVNQNKAKIQKKNQVKFILINKFPKLFKLYMKIRRKF
jgi:hypothetical protein